MDHLNEEELVDYLTGQMLPQCVETVEFHLHACKDCAARARSVHRVCCKWGVKTLDLAQQDWNKPLDEVRLRQLGLSGDVLEEVLEMVTTQPTPVIPSNFHEARILIDRCRARIESNKNLDDSSIEGFKPL